MATHGPGARGGDLCRPRRPGRRGSGRHGGRRSGPSGSRLAAPPSRCSSPTARETHPRWTAIFEARPDVLNHNIETVARLQRAVRPQAGYARSLAVLARAGAVGLVTKSGSHGRASANERTRWSPPWPTSTPSASPSSPSASTCVRAGTTYLWSRYWSPEEFGRLKAIEGGARPPPRRVVAPDAIELSRQGGRGRGPLNESSPSRCGNLLGDAHSWWMSSSNTIFIAVAAYFAPDAPGRRLDPAIPARRGALNDGKPDIENERAASLTSGWWQSSRELVMPQPRTV